MCAVSPLGQRGKPKRQRAPRAAVSSEGALCGLADNGGGGRPRAVLVLSGWGRRLGLIGWWDSPKEVAGLALSPKPGGKSRGGILSVDGCRDDPACVARAFACRVEPLVGEVAVVLVAGDAHGRGGAALEGDQLGLLAEEAARRAVEGAEALLEALGEEARHPVAELAAGQSHRVGARGQARG